MENFDLIIFPEVGIQHISHMFVYISEIIKTFFLFLPWVRWFGSSGVRSSRHRGTEFTPVPRSTLPLVRFSAPSHKHVNLSRCSGQNLVRPTKPFYSFVGLRKFILCQLHSLTRFSKFKSRLAKLPYAE